MNTQTENGCEEVGCNDLAVRCFLMGARDDRLGGYFNYRICLCEKHAEEFRKRSEQGYEGIEGKIQY